MVARLLLMLAGAAAVPAAAPAAPTPSGVCEGILPSQDEAGPSRPLIPEDLVRLRDIGPVDPEPHEAPFFTVSPDGGRVAFQLRRADPDRNAYCLAMVVMALSPGAPPRIVDTGGEIQLLNIDIRGTADFPTGIPAVVTPRWSPDGRWIAFLKREGGSTQVWRAQADGSGSVRLTHDASDVVDFRIGPEGSSIVYATRPGLRRAYAAIAREGLRGFHYDDRFAPVSGDRPFPAPPIAAEAQVLDLASAQIRAASAAEAALVGIAPTDESPPMATTGADAGPRLWISARTLLGEAEPGALHAQRPGGPVAACVAPACAGAKRPWWMADRQRVRFFRREGWGRAATGIYEWRPATGSVRRLYATEDVLAHCEPTDEMLLCLREGSLEPRRLERLDPRTGRRELLFDPNPQFARLELGRVQRLYWRNDFGLEAFGDLVVPVGYREGERYPLVIVQYDTRGFLRGGTGDEYPIQAFASRGYAVLSLRRPQAMAFVRGARSFREGNRLNLIGFADRRSTLSSVETGVRLVIDRGIADPARIGITGLSDGATSTISAILHSRLFSAAAMSTCCIDTTLAMRVGPAGARAFRETGYPGMLERDDPFWREISLSVNARRVAMPILLQLADDEYMSALETYTALREAGAPVDMFVFPGEHHVKWQPAHRLAVFRRSLDWFDFWLRGIRSQAPDRQAELDRWDALRVPASSQGPG